MIQRKVIKPVDFIDLDALAQRLRAFEPRYTATAKPFDWIFTRTDLALLLRRLTLTSPLPSRSWLRESGMMTRRPLRPRRPSRA